MTDPHLFRTVFSAVLAGTSLRACGDSKPEHYYVFCDSKDGDWTLVDTKYQDGYIIACNYQSPDLSNVRTDMCSDQACD